MKTAKSEVEALLRRLPDDCTLGDVQYQLYVLAKIHEGIRVADTQGTISQAEVEERLRRLHRLS